MFSKADIEKYFNAEKQESLLFLIIGIAAIITAIIFFFVLKKDIFKGAALPLLLIGIIQTVVGYAVYARSDSDRVRIVYAYDMSPGDLKQKEIPRMKTVNRNFVIYRWTEIALAIAGIVCILLFKNNIDKSFWYGLGITLLLQSLIMLAADYFAEKRALQYTKGLESFIEQK